MPWKNRVSSIPSDRCIVAWDVETVPLPESDLTAVHQERVEKETRNILEYRSDLNDVEAQRLAQSTHALTGRICCISAVAGTLSEGHREPVSFTAPTLEDEAEMLAQFWSRISGFNCKPVWVTFNGKKFDVPFLLARSAHYGIETSRSDLIDTYPYSFDPHADLYNAFQPNRYTLEDMCTLLGVESSKSDLDGSQVADAVADGRIDEVAAYCESDVVATWLCFAKMHSYLS